MRTEHLQFTADSLVEGTAHMPKSVTAEKPRITAFTLVELLIVVSILGILAAIVLPEFQNHSTLAKEAAAKENLRVLRNAIEITTQNIIDVQFETPANPFNGLSTIGPVPGQFSAEATGQYGYLYQPTTKTIRLDWPGTDSDGVRYFDY